MSKIELLTEFRPTRRTVLKVACAAAAVRVAGRAALEQMKLSVSQERR